MSDIVHLRVLASMWLLAALAVQVDGGVGIQPAYVECQLDRGRPAGKFVVSNLGNTSERYRIKVVHFRFLKDGGVREVKPDERSLATWIKFNPRELTLAPKTKRSVRRGKLKAGEYWAGMELESLNTSTITGSDGAGKHMKVEVIPSILVPIFGTVGNVTYGGKVTSVSLEQGKAGPRIRFLLKNTGNGRLLLRGAYRIASESGKDLASGPCGIGYVLPGDERYFVADIDKDVPKGNYTVRVRYAASQLKRDINFKVDVANERLLVYKKPGAGANGDRASGKASSGRPTSAQTETEAKPGQGGPAKAVGANRV